MIGREVALLSRDLVNNDTRIVAQAVEFTPLRDLVRLSEHPFANELKIEEGKDRLVEEIVKVTTTQLPGMSMTHDVRMTEVVSMHSKVLLKRLMLAKDTILPLLTTVASRANQALGNAIADTWEVNTLKLPPLYRSEKLGEFLAEYPATLIRDASTLNGLADRSEEEIVGLLNTGNTALNQLVVEVVASHPTMWLTDIYRKYFCAGDQTKINTRFDPIVSYSMVDELLVVHILARVLTMRDVVDAGISLSLNEYRQRLAEIIVATGSTLNRALSKLSLFVNQGVLIANVDNTTRTIYVFEEVYENFLTQGGTAEAVIGAVESGNQTLFYQKLLERKEDFASIAENKHQERLLQIRNNFLPSLQKVLVGILTEELRELSAETLALFVFPKDYLDVKAGEVLTEMRIQQFAIVLSSLVPRAGENNDIENIVRFLLVDCALPHLEIRKFFVMMNELAKEAEQNGQPVKPREIAYWIVIDELAETIVRDNIRVPEIGQQLDFAEVE